MTGNAEFYQSHLDRVSRSFAFCIRQLPHPLHDWIGLSYLLCRVVDTIEDSAWPSLESQMAAFELFDRALKDEGQVVKLEDWAKAFPDNVPESERLLLNDASRLFRDFHAFPEQVHGIIQELVLSMSSGMQHFCQQRENGSLRLKNLAEVNQYCFFVAGVVGELLAKLMAKVEPRFGLSQLNLLRAHHFGLFLQKVNLLKDQVGDEKVGRHLIPSRDLVEDSSQENANQAFDFLLDLPREQIEFRRFCAWSLFMGLEAMSVARNSLLKNRVLKIPRAELETLLIKVEEALADDGALRSLFSFFTSKLGWPKTLPRTQVTPAFPDWLLKIYPGPLNSASLAQLGVTSV